MPEYFHSDDRNSSCVTAAFSLPLATGTPTPGRKEGNRTRTVSIFFGPSPASPARSRSGWTLAGRPAPDRRGYRRACDAPERSFSAPEPASVAPLRA